MKTLRFSTAGNVDDGKSTLIGRLLYDGSYLSEDLRPDPLRLHEVTDGLRLEREKGITLDIAYRYFSHSKKSFVLLDCPGHWELLGNFFTGLSQSDACLFVVDATRPLSPQTIRHLDLIRFLGIEKVAFCLNKLDRIEDPKTVCAKLIEEMKGCVRSLKSEMTFIPISALTGENVFHRSQRLGGNETVSSWLDRVEAPKVSGPLRIRVQGIFGATCYAQGPFGVSGPVNLAFWDLRTAQKKEIRLESIHLVGEGAVSFANHSGLSRGTILFHPDEPPFWEKTARAEFFRFPGTEATNGHYRLQIAEQVRTVRIEKLPEPGELGFIELTSQEPFAYDSLGSQAELGRFLLQNPGTQEILGAGIFR